MLRVMHWAWLLIKTDAIRLRGVVCFGVEFAGVIMSFSDVSRHAVLYDTLYAEKLVAAPIPSRWGLAARTRPS